jgi:hypothetical protein
MKRRFHSSVNQSRRFLSSRNSKKCLRIGTKLRENGAKTKENNFMQVETALIDSSFLPIVLDFRDVLKKINDDEFESFCRHNPDVEIELT